MKIVIIGNGIAGNQVAFTLIQQGSTDEICIISAENVPEYDPCSLPYFLGGDVEKNAVFRKKMEDYDQHNIELVFNLNELSRKGGLPDSFSNQLSPHTPGAQGPGQSSTQEQSNANARARTKKAG